MALQKEIIIFTDGASKGNPGPGGWGAIVATNAEVKELGGREENTTNNRMELRAALEALSFASLLHDAPVVLHTDSSYVINGVTKWSHGWKTRGWVTKEKREVLNQDLWKDLLDAAENFSNGLAWQYVGGHVGIAGNERVDEIASDFADGKKVELYSGPFEGYGVDVKNISLDESKKKQKSASRSRSKVAAYSYISEVEGVVMTHATWRECEARVKGKRARFKKATSAEEEAEIIKTFSK
jgi:ribonuclease HI